MPFIPGFWWWTALVPRSLGVNPLLTITALAERRWTILYEPMQPMSRSAVQA